MVNKEYLKEYYQKNKDLIKQRSRERYHRTKKNLSEAICARENAFNELIEKNGS